MTPTAMGLEGTDELLFDVIGLDTDGVPELKDRIESAQDLARSVRARRAALESIEDMK